MPRIHALSARPFCDFGPEKRSLDLHLQVSISSKSLLLREIRIQVGRRTKKHRLRSILGPLFALSIAIKLRRPARLVMGEVATGSAGI
jgi:hypothetical protein